ncbi:hypothetical protein [Costertonia aggregata]|uniref:DUF892 family protein n=1 Tax=Costertonia aggregata TaxID=343403 RepID=A0A7H9AST3_9FLAO|nr:hypothetical protein [Costertonia aggregata]QLG46500.1 hypothetical protein HYG79_14475 [Costertonia aggregata]
MNKRKQKSDFLYGVFVLREQLHTYLDILDKHRKPLDAHLGETTTLRILTNKKVLLERVEDKFMALSRMTISNAENFEPYESPWINSDGLPLSNSKRSILKVLVDFDKVVMVWCYFFITAEEIDADDAGFMLSLIQDTKFEIDNLIAELEQ